MTSTMNEDTPLSTLYLQIEYGDTLSTVLGVGGAATEAEIRDAYRSLALRIHPDKAPNDTLRKLHTWLFQKVQSFYDAIPNSQSAKYTESTPVPSKQLPETLASLRARNIAAKEALQAARSRVIDAKHGPEAQKKAKVKAKNERLAGIREARVQARVARDQKHGKKVARETGSKEEPKENAAATGSQQTANSAESQDWEQEEDRLEAEDQSRPKRSKSKAPPQNRPTARSAKPIWDPAVDERIVSDAEIRGRWDTDLLNGGTSGSVSLSEKEQRAHNAAATTHQALTAQINEADNLYHPNSNARHRGVTAHLFEDVVGTASLQQEAEVDAMVDKALGTIDQDVIEQHLLEDGKLERGVSIGSLAIKWE